ncbi:MAG: DUF368 domain-containing protein [Turicibacter sp.]|nr:DUF368 domain-containing protein [Turicibacter sp.]
MKKTIVNFIKGIFIGMGAVLPGLSGGALAAIFGIYEPLITFVSDIKKDFVANLKFFLPVLAGGLFGVFLLSHVLSYFLTHNLAEISVFFVGCMLGVFGALVRQTGAKGRDPFHVVLAIGVAIGAFLLLSHGFPATTSEVGHPANVSILQWVTSGGIIGLGVTFPGLSPSNFLMHLGLYLPLTEAISHVDLAVLFPVAIGGLLAVILTAKLVSYLLRVAYAMVYHIILGLVLASTALIVPRDFGSNLVAALCLITGLVVGSVMSRFEANEANSLSSVSGERNRE